MLACIVRSQRKFGIGTRFIFRHITCHCTVLILIVLSVPFCLCVPSFFLVVKKSTSEPRRAAWEFVRLAGTFAPKAVQDAAFAHGCHSPGRFSSIAMMGVDGFVAWFWMGLLMRFDGWKLKLS